MNILINASNLSGGGGGQVADSICSYTDCAISDNFVVVYSDALQQMGKRITHYPNVRAIRYNYPKKDWRSLLTGRNSILDKLVVEYQIDCVLTVFGPMKWIPKCSHICGFARPHLVIPESPFFKAMPLKNKIKSKLSNILNSYLFQRNTKFLFTENPYISARVKKLINNSEVRTITNNYNQIFDQKGKWKNLQLPESDGSTILTLASPYPHKNLSITVPITKYLSIKYPEFHFRFVLSINENELPGYDNSLQDHFVFLGKVAIEECPSLYQQCDIAFVPSLLECFTAMYAEAMKMEKPIVTTNLPYAEGLCGAAALYYSPLSYEEAAEVIMLVCKDVNLRANLIKSGKQQLANFDTSKQRFDKLIEYCHQIVK